MNRTALLVLILSALLLIHYYPGLASPIWLLALAGGTAWLVSTARRYHRYLQQERAKAALVAADEQEYRLYESEVATLRAGGPLPEQELEAHFAELQVKYRAMLDRRFGPH